MRLVANCPATEKRQARNRPTAAGSALRQGAGGVWIGETVELLGQNGTADVLLRHDILRDGRIEERFASPSGGHIDAQEHFIGTQWHLPDNFLFAVSANVQRALYRDRIGSNSSPRATDKHPIRAGKCLAGSVTLALHASPRIDGSSAGIARRNRRGFGVTQERAARSGTRRRQRANGARRLFNHQINVGLSAPRNLQIDIAYQRLINGGLKGEGSIGLPSLFQLLDGCLGQTSGTQRNLLLAGWPLMGQHAGAGPLQGSKIVAAGRQRHGQCKSLPLRWVESGGLFAQPDGLRRRPGAGQIICQEQ